MEAIIMLVKVVLMIHYLINKNLWYQQYPNLPFLHTIASLSMACFIYLCQALELISVHIIIFSHISKTQERGK